MTTPAPPTPQSDESAPAEVFLLSCTDRNIEVHRLPGGEIMITCGSILSANDAVQLYRGLLAVTQGGFESATTEYSLNFRLNREAATRPTPLQPSLGML